MPLTDHERERIQGLPAWARELILRLVRQNDDLGEHLHEASGGAQSRVSWFKLVDSKGRHFAIPDDAGVEYRFRPQEGTQFDRDIVIYQSREDDSIQIRSMRGRISILPEAGNSVCIRLED